MFCEKCGTNVPESTNCPKCGHTQGNLGQPETNNKSCGWMEKIVKYSKIILFALQVIVLVISIYNVKEISEVNKMLGIFITSRVFPIDVIVCITGILVCIVNIIYASKHKPLTDYQCPKCEGITHHNKYNVCNNCNYDYKSSIYLSLVYFSIWCISYIIPEIIKHIIFRYGFSESLQSTVSRYSEFSVISAILIIIFSIFVIITPIYMYPAKLARRTEHSAATAIFWLNIFFGGTLIMWLILLIWGSSGKGNSKTVVIQQAPTQPTVGNSFEELQKLKDMGMISAEEFDEKRKELLKRI